MRRYCQCQLLLTDSRATGRPLAQLTPLEVARRRQQLLLMTMMKMRTTAAAAVASPRSS